MLKSLSDCKNYIEYIIFRLVSLVLIYLGNFSFPITSNYVFVGKDGHNVNEAIYQVVP